MEKVFALKAEGDCLEWCVILSDLKLSYESMTVCDFLVKVVNEFPCGLKQQALTVDILKLGWNNRSRYENRWLKMAMRDYHPDVHVATGYASRWQRDVCEEVFKYLSSYNSTRSQGLVKDSTDTPVNFF